MLCRKIIIKYFECTNPLVRRRTLYIPQKGYREGPLLEKSDRFCKWLKEQHLPVNWKDVQDKHAKVSFRTNMPFAFEIRTIHCLLNEKEGDNSEVKRSFLNFLENTILQSSTLQSKSPTTDKKHLIFEVHLASLKASVDPVKYKEEIKETVKDCSNQRVLNQDLIFINILKQLASISREDCMFVKDVVQKNELKCQKEIIVKCLDHGLIKDAVELVDSTDESISNWVSDNIEGWMNGIEKSDSRRAVTDFLKMMKDLCGSIPYSSERRIKELMECSNYSHQVVSLDDNGVCCNCGTRIKGFEEEDFKACSEKALQNIVEREDIFFNTTPEEIQNFMSFISKMKADFAKNQKSPTNHLWFDCVIDGLNVRQVRNAIVYDDHIKPKVRDRQIGSYMSRDIMEENLRTVFTKCLELFQGRILLIGRKHMRNMRTIKRIQEKEPRVSTYFIEDISRDDPFIIFSALQSMNTYIVSNDLFRDHKFLMKDPLFGRWLNSRVIKIPKNFAIFVPPLYHLSVNVSSDGQHVHIPYVSSSGNHVKWTCSQSQQTIKKKEIPKVVEFPPLFSRIKNSQE
jgi:hypothetical protein